MKVFFKGFVFAFQGIIAGLKTERNFKIQFVIGLIVVCASAYFHLSKLKWCAVIFAIGLVLGLELINSAIENLVDIVMPEKNMLAGRIKDFAAGAVLLAAMASAIVGALVFWPYLKSMFTL